MARTRCLMMQRDETALLDAWFQYHGHLFGFENLTVLDNGSTDPDSVGRLRRYQRAGSTILWRGRTEDDHEARFDHFGAIVAQWDRDGGYDMAIPLECGEYVALFSPYGLSCGRDDIEAYLEPLARTGHQFEIGLGLAAASGAGFYRDQPVSRSLWTRRTTEAASEQRSLELTCVQVGSRAPPASVRRREIERGVLTGFPALARLMAALGVETDRFGDGGSGAAEADRVPILLPARRRQAGVFDGRSYLALNPDVQAAGWPALKHYLMRGFAEQRRIA